MSLAQLPNELVFEIAYHVNFPELRCWVLVARKYHWLLINVLYDRAVSHKERLSPVVRHLKPFHYHIRTVELDNLPAFRALVQRTKNTRDPAIIHLPGTKTWNLGLVMALLHVVSSLGKPDMTRALLDAGAAPADGDSGGHTALHYASRHGHVSIATMLLEAGADPNAVGCTGATPLRWACQSGQAPMVRLLLNRGVDVSGLQQLYPSLPLFWAVESNSCEIIRLLVDAGADITSRLRDGTTALHVAAGHCRETETVPLLLHLGADAYARLDDGSTPLHVVSNAASARDLLDHEPGLQHCQDILGYTPLELMFQNSWLKRSETENAVVAVLERSASRLSGSQLVIDILCHATRDGHTAIFSHILATYGASTCGFNSRGSTPLHIAALKGNAGMVRQLLSAGVDPNVRCRRHKRTALCAAASAYDRKARDAQMSLSAYVEALLDATSFYEPVHAPVTKGGALPVIKILLRSQPRICHWDDGARITLRNALYTPKADDDTWLGSECCGEAIEV